MSINGIEIAISIVHMRRDADKCSCIRRLTQSTFFYLLVTSVEFIRREKQLEMVDRSYDDMDKPKEQSK
jgi:hypothetical protein